MLRSTTAPEADSHIPEPNRPLKTDPSGAVVTADDLVPTYRLGVVYSTFGGAGAKPLDIWQFRNSRDGIVSRIKRIRMDGALSAAQVTEVRLIKRSTPSTGGVASTTSGVSMDSRDLPSIGVVDQWTTLQPLVFGTQVGIIGELFPALPSTTPASGDPQLLWEFGGNGRKPLIVRGACEALCLSLNGTTMGAFGSGLITIEAEWTESPQ